MLNVRRLAAIDIALLGPRIIIAEFSFGVIVPLAIGIFMALRGRSVNQALLSAYFVTLGVNYVPLLLHAWSLRDRSRARSEISSELGSDPQAAMRRYRRGSMLLLLPLVIPVLAVMQARVRNAAERVS